jgi:hypothetical protein
MSLTPSTIRLIELLPAQNEDDDLYISLGAVSLLDPEIPSYEAISYCQGDPKDTRPIF